MRRAQVTTLLLLLFGLMLNGCKGGEAESNKAAASKPQAQAPSGATSPPNNNHASVPENATGNVAASKDASSKPKNDTAPQLLGEYQVREIQDKGVVTMVSAIQTSFYFLADGSYSRTSKKEGRTYHSDSGRFRIEPPDKLILTIMVSGQGVQQKIQQPPLEKMHKFTLSPDGDELTLTSDKGSAAVLRRVAKPKAG